MPGYLSEQQIQEFKERGYLIIKDFLKCEEADLLKSACHKLVDEFDHDNYKKEIFDASGDCGAQRSDYFLTSHNKVRFFYENGALDEQGNLIVPKHHAFNKIGHYLHQDVPEFKAVTFDHRMKSVAKDLGFHRPAVCQSMYIFKAPNIGGKVHAHQDATFLWTEPTQRLFGVWIALEDTTETNGCLYFVPGSHKNGLVNERRMVRDSENKLIFRGEAPDMSHELYEAACVSKGSAVLIDGFVVHKSEENRSDKSREIYTWHIVDTHEQIWSPENWIASDIKEFVPLIE